MDEAKISILYAEDDEFGAKLTKTILEKENFEVEIVSDGSEAWKAYKERKPDILLLDLDMPGKDGLEITRLVREHDQQTPILVYTTHGEPAKEVAVLDAGADEFINKERPPEVLIAYMKRVREKIKKYMNIPHLYRLSDHTTYNSITQELIIDGITTQLKTIDGRFLQLLCAKNHEVSGKSYLIHGIWGKADINKESELKKYASRVRTNLKTDPTLKIEFRDEGYILMSVSGHMQQ
ncbi:response regulator transcription factor [Odoribacter splanchnicus]|uniref:Response regulator n=1 Tax=Odoribacter splanchnicus TaxID=28118 RepID=A0AAW5C1K1_9BACT|nr:response regulator [Odoribacter splanchnicus]MBV4399881.1 response regulator [Odoribacter splanchnicus]MBV4408366.1 response regulator [Odoribacter splanchnicus]MCG4958867.1 response regulator [Odoribacter splanchnicus]MCG5002137.1 response regulator [Odoribacter splanchnicus]